ncbi:Gfo/Idh/MocA family oxidoreductase, partial [bacterium]|nr:Gfo/Idh/MocA family oxidoreductase [bacterium]
MGRSDGTRDRGTGPPVRRGWGVPGSDAPGLQHGGGAEFPDGYARAPPPASERVSGGAVCRRGVSRAGRPGPPDGTDSRDRQHRRGPRHGGARPLAESPSRLDIPVRAVRPVHRPFADPTSVASDVPAPGTGLRGAWGHPGSLLVRCGPAAGDSGDARHGAPGRTPLREKAMKTINAAVIGTGFIGPAHVEALRRVPGVEVVAIASNEPERAREVADRFGVPRVYDTWEAVLRDPDVAVVHNCTPNNLHYAINRAALLARKHVLSEKPLTLTSRESAELVALARKTGLVNGVNFNYRFYPLIQHARAMVNAGELGEPFLIHGHYLQDWLHAPTDYNWRIDPAISG